MRLKLLLQTLSLLIVSSLVDGRNPAHSAEPNRQFSHNLFLQGHENLDTTLTEAIQKWSEQASKYQQQNKLLQEVQTRFKIAQGHIEQNNLVDAEEELDAIINVSSSSKSTALAWAKKARISWIKGKDNQAIKRFEKSLKSNQTTSVLNNLARILLEREEVFLFTSRNSREQSIAESFQRKANRDRTLAEKYINQALILAKHNPNLSFIRTKILLHEKFNQDFTEAELSEASKILGSVPYSRKLIYTLIDWSKVDRQNRLSWLEKADYSAKSIDDDYAASYVKVELGKYFLGIGELDLAQQEAEQALSFATQNYNDDGLFRSRKLLANISKQKEEIQAAIFHYYGAITAIDSLLVQNADYAQTSKIFDFKEDLEPIYRDTLSLLLQGNPSQERLNSAIQVNDKLRLAQLREFFHDNCFEIEDTPTDLLAKNSITENENQNQNNSTVIYSIVLEDRSYFLLRSPDKKIHLSEQHITSSKLEELARDWLNSLYSLKAWGFRTKARQLYDLIIKPLETELEQINPEEVVFIHDNYLRNLPMAALLDRDNTYFVEKYASLSSLGYEFTPTPKKRQKPKVLGFSLQEYPNWPPLLGVKEEINKIEEKIGGKVYSDEKFTVENLSKEVKSQKFSILHLATHGYFSGDESTSFLLASNRKISALQLENILRQSQQTIELLVLSACDTGVSSELSFLGLAGMASRSGISSVVGNFWQVDDEHQVDMMLSFYSFLNEENTSKAEAIQKAQIKEIHNIAHPRKWAALNLIGNI